MKKKLQIVVLLFFSLSVCSQQDSVLYNFLFQFTDGLYLNFDQLKNNNPIKFNQIINFTINSNNFSILDTIDNIQFYDSNGVLNSLSKKELWGYSVSGRPYIYFADKFNMLSNIGKISFFATTVLVRRYYGGGYDIMYGGFYDPFPQRHIVQEEVKMFLINWDNGKVFDYSIKSVELLLKGDPELITQYNKLSKRKKEKEKYNYIILFNEKHQLYFPKF